MKEESRKAGPWEFGEYKTKGGQKDNKNASNKEMAERIRDNEVVDLVLDGSIPFYRAKAALEFKDMLTKKKIHLEEKEDLPKKRHYWIHGPPNCGKTTFKDTLKDTFEIPKNKDWEGYSGQRTLWIDEFKG